MQDDLFWSLYLSIGLRTGHRSELRLTTPSAQVVSDLYCIELSTIVKYHGSRDSKASNDVFPNELLHFRGGDRDNDLYLYPLGEIIRRNKRILMLTGDLGKSPKMFIPHVAKGKGLMMGVSDVVSFRCTRANFWYLSHLRTKSMSSSFKDGQ